MRILPIITLLITILIGCAMFKTNYEYSIIAKNNGERLIKDVEIKSINGFWHETGYLSKDATKGIIGPQSVAPNSTYTVIIEREGQQASKHIIDLHDKIEKSFKGDIIVLIDDGDNVSYELKTR